MPALLFNFIIRTERTPKKENRILPVVYLKKCCQRVAPSLTPWALLNQLGRIVLVEVWFELKNGGTICLPRVTQPESAQAALLARLEWTLPAQPPPRVYAADAANAG